MDVAPPPAVLAPTLTVLRVGPPPSRGESHDPRAEQQERGRLGHGQITERTVEKHSERVLRKLGVETRTGAATLALETLQARSRLARTS